MLSSLSSNALYAFHVSVYDRTLCRITLFKSCSDAISVTIVSSPNQSLIHDCPPRKRPNISGFCFLFCPIFLIIPHLFTNKKDFRYENIWIFGNIRFPLPMACTFPLLQSEVGDNLPHTHGRAPEFCRAAGRSEQKSCTFFHAELMFFSVCGRMKTKHRLLLSRQSQKVYTSPGGIAQWQKRKPKKHP